MFSIKSVCESLEIQSKSAASAGFILKLQGDSRTLTNGPSVQGTRVIIEDPFTNLSVRRHDWKRRRNTYANAILKSVMQYSLAYAIRFRLNFSWTSEFNFTSYTAKSAEERIYRILGVQPSHHLEGVLEEHHCECYLFADRPEIKYLYVNGHYSSVGYKNLHKEYGYVLLIRTKSSELYESRSKATSAAKSLLIPPETTVLDWISKSVGEDIKGRIDAEPNLKMIKPIEVQGKAQFSDIQPCKISEESCDTLSSSDLLRAMVIGQFNNGFIICQLDDRLLIVDQHAADERIFYEAFRDLKLQSSVQRLVVPKRLVLEYEYQQALESRKLFLKEYGFEFISDESGTYMASAPFVSGNTFSESGN